MSSDVALSKTCVLSFSPEAIQFKIQNFIVLIKTDIFSFKMVQQNKRLLTQAFMKLFKIYQMYKNINH